MVGLTEKQKVFVDEYLIDINATQAAIRAGYSPKSASDIGLQLLGKPRVHDAVACALAERRRRTGISQDTVLRELARIAFVNPGDVINFKEGTVKEGASKDDLAVIASVKVKTSTFGEGGLTEEREVKLLDKLKALDMLCKHLGMYTKDDGGGGNGNEGKAGVVILPAVMEATSHPEVIDNG